MSNLALNAVSNDYAEKRLMDLIKEYNSQPLTEEGRRELVSQYLATAFLAGYNLKQQTNKANVTFNCKHETTKKILEDFLESGYSNFSKYFEDHTDYWTHELGEKSFSTAVAELDKTGWLNGI